MKTYRPPSYPSAHGQFRPEKFQKKSTLRDYAIYGALLLFVAAIAGAGYYYFTRSPQEKKRLQSQVGSALPREAEPAPGGAPGTAARTTEQLDQASAYAGGGPNRVLASEDPNAPRPGPVFTKFATGLKISGVVPGASAKAVLNGTLYHAGDVIDRSLGITLVGVNGEKKFLILRDKNGVELRLTY
jgi:hypothetical protein